MSIDFQPDSAGTIDFKPDEPKIDFQPAAAPKSTRGQTEIENADAQQQIERDTATGGAPDALKNLGSGLADTLKSLVPQSIRDDPMGLVTLGPNSGGQLADVLGMLSPVNSTIEDLKKHYEVGKDVLGGASLEEATRKNAPESFSLADADKTPAFSKERFTAGLGTLTQMLMAAGIVHGTPKLGPRAEPALAEPVRPVEAPQVDPATAIEQAPMSEVVAPETPSPAPTEPTIADATGTEAVRATPPQTENAPRTAKEWGDAMPSSESFLQPNNKVDQPYALPETFREGTLHIDKYGENPFVYEARFIDPQQFKDNLKLEGMSYESVVNMPTTQKYIEWYKQGHQPPPIDVIVKQTTGEMGKLSSTNRRRVVAALEAGVDRIPALVEIGRRDDLWRSKQGGAKLLPGENQGDLISSTQSEPFALVGEKGVDTKASTEAAAQRAEEARLKAEHEQGLLDDFQEHQAQGGDELLDAVHSGGGLPAKSSPRADILSGELKNIREELVSETGQQKTRGFDYNRIFKKDAADLDTLTQHLRSKGFDVETPNDTLSLIQERLRSGKPVYGSEVRGGNDWTTATEPSTGGGMRLGSGERGSVNLQPLKDLQETALLKRRMSPLDEATGQRSARLQKSFADAERSQKEIKRVAPTERRQGAISLWMEANGDPALLDQWAQNAKGEKFKQAAESAKSLSPEEIAIAQKAQSAFSILEKRGTSYDVLSNHRDNYVPHVWDVTKDFSGVGSAKLQDKFKFNKARTFENFFEGDQAGFTPKTLAIGKLLPAYLHEMNKVIADRQFVQDVAHMTATDKRPLVVPRGNAKTVETTDYVVRDENGQALPKFKKAVYETEAEAKAALQPGQTIEKRPSSSALVNPRGFAKAEDAKGNPIEQGDYKVPANQPALSNWRWVETDPQGGSTILKSDLAVHPELAKRLNAMMGKSAIREWYNEPASGISTIPKAIAKGLDTAQAVMKREMFGLLAPFHQVQEGTHGVGHLVNPFFGLEDMSRPTPEHVDAMKHGLMLLPDRGSGQSYIEGVGGKGSFLTQAGRWLGDKLDDTTTRTASRGGTTISVSKGGPGATAATVARGMSDVIDGYQNYLFHQYIPSLKFKTYEHIQARNMERYSGELARKELTDGDVKLLSAEQTNAAYGHLNYALLDRNPTMQHILQLTLLAPDFLEARARFTGQALKTLAGSKSGVEQFRAIATLAAVQAGIAYTTSKLMGDEWDPKHPFEVTHNGRTYTFRSVPEDLHRLLLQGSDQRREFVSARVNPTAQKVDQLRTGLNYRGEKTGAIDTMEELLANYIPITARAIPGIRSLTETSRNSPVSPLEQLAGSLGMKISRHSPITKVHQLASEWMDSQKMERDKGVYPVSKFQQLRYALEDGDLSRGRDEWKKLLQKGTTPKKLAEGFRDSIEHPFTKSKASDDRFKAQLKPADRIIYEHAINVRKGILHKFTSVSGVSSDR